MENIGRKNVAIYGSCISKDPFTTLFNKNYKERYNCIINDQKHSFISTMQEKEEFDESDLLILPDDAPNRFLTKCIKEDLEKTFIEEMLNNEIEYLVLDVNFEVYKGIISFNETKFLTNITGFEETKFFSKLNNVEYINIIDSPNEYFEIWKEYCDKFFNFLKTNCPNTKIILAEVRALDVVQRDDLSTYVEPNFTKIAKLSNIYFKKLEDYIKKNFDVYVIKFDKDTVLKENHNWGKFFVHYDDDYYSNFLKKVDRIVEYEELKKKVESLTEENEFLKEEINDLRNNI